MSTCGAEGVSERTKTQGYNLAAGFLWFASTVSALVRGATTPWRNRGVVTTNSRPRCVLQPETQAIRGFPRALAYAGVSGKTERGEGVLEIRQDRIELDRVCIALNQGTAEWLQRICGNALATIPIRAIL